MGVRPMPFPPASAIAGLSRRDCRKTLLLVILFCFFHVPSCIAATYSVTQTAQFSFGTLQQPSSGSQTCIMAPAGTSCTGGSTGTYLFGSQSAGRYTIKCAGSGCGGPIVTI